jgi:hypothetical protein
MYNTVLLCFTSAFGMVRDRDEVTVMWKFTDSYTFTENMLPSWLFKF